MITPYLIHKDTISIFIVYVSPQLNIVIIEHAIEMFDETLNKSDLPKSIRIFGSIIEVSYTSRHEGTLCLSSEVSKVALAELVFANTVHNTGFLIR